MAVLLEEGEVGLPHGIKGMGLKDRVADEIIGFARGVPADLPCCVPCPEGRPAAFADLTGKSLGFEIVELVFLFEH
jgi:hypothetical protein